MIRENSIKRQFNPLHKSRITKTYHADDDGPWLGGGPLKTAAVITLNT